MNDTIADSVMDETVIRLLMIANNYHEQDAEHDIAVKLLEHAGDIDKCTLEQMAQRCFTSATSLSRFIKKMGFQNYSVFKSVFAKQIKGNWSGEYVFPNDNRNIAASSVQSVIRRIAREDAEAIARLGEEIQEGDIGEIIRLIHEADYIYLVGNEMVQSCIVEFQHRMLLAGKYVDYHAGWIDSQMTKPNSLRLELVIEHTFSVPEEQKKLQRVKIHIVERLKKEEKGLMDVHIFVRDIDTLIQSGRLKHLDEGINGLLLLRTILKMVSIAYAEKYEFLK